MTVVYVGQEFPKKFHKALMLVGPTPRTPEVPSWRPEAIKILAELGYDGVVFVPESADGKWREDYVSQVETEEKMLRMADCIVCWIPRDMTIVNNTPVMPALTTNDEWGAWKYSGKCVFGAPERIGETDKKTPHVRYQQYYADKLSIPSFKTLEDTLRGAVDRIGAGSMRQGGERDIPLYIWNTTSFQLWYAAQLQAGNRLDGASVEWTFRVGAKKDIVFFSALHVNIYVAREDRNKTNEIVLCRPGVKHVVAFYRDGDDPMNTRLILVREFRSTASTSDGFIREVPGGSSLKSEDARTTAAKEFFEETGIKIGVGRLRTLCARQLAGTTMAHQAHVFSVELTYDEMQQAEARAGVQNGNRDDSEITYVEIVTLRDLVRSPLTDWSNLGMIFTAIMECALTPGTRFTRDEFRGNPVDF